MKVLIVDDELELVETMVARLRRRQFEVEGVSNGFDALKRLAEESFDIVLVDVRMPGMSGLELIREIKTRLPEQQVVMLTGHGSSEHAEEGMRLGAYAYLMKPVKLPDLIDILTRAAADDDDGGVEGGTKA